MVKESYRQEKTEKVIPVINEKYRIYFQIF